MFFLLMMVTTGWFGILSFDGVIMRTPLTTLMQCLLLAPGWRGGPRATLLMVGSDNLAVPPPI